MCVRKARVQHDEQQFPSFVMGRQKYIVQQVATGAILCGHGGNKESSEAMVWMVMESTVFLFNYRLPIFM